MTRHSDAASGLSGADTGDPSSPGPSGTHARRGLRILAADQRSEHAGSSTVPVDLAALTRLLEAALLAEGVPAGAEASLTLVDPDDIAELKAEHLDGDGSPTDVLSFPIDGLDGPEESGGHPGDTWMVGDVVLCPLVAAGQAPTHAGSLEDELALLVVHSALHLTGWDHAIASERDAMWERERVLLIDLHREPVLDPWSEPVR